MSSDLVIKKSKVYQKFNLKELFGVSIADLPEIREAFAQAVIDKILERTANGDWRPGGKPDADANRYKESYANSLAFKAAGKKKNKVDMSLFGDMMGSMGVIDETSNTVTIGWDDETEILKSFNHNVGETVPRRPFFGLAPSEIKELKREFEPVVRETMKDVKENGRDAETEAALRLLERVKAISAKGKESDES